MAYKKRNPYKKNKPIKLILILVGFLLIIISIYNISNKKQTTYDPNDNLKKLKSYEDVISNFPLDLQANLNLAKIYYTLAKEDDIFYYYFLDTAIPDQFIVNTMHKWDYLGYNVNSLRNDLDIKSPDIRKKILKRMKYIKYDLYEKSLKYYRKVLALSPSILTVKDLYFIGMIYYKLNDSYLKYSYTYLEKALEQGFKNSEIFTVLGNIFYSLNDFSKAKYYYLKAYNYNKDSIIIIYNYSNVLFLNKEYKEAEKMLNKIINKLREKFNNKDDNITNEKILKSIIPLKTKQQLGKIYYLLANVYNSENKFDNALHYYRKAEDFLPFSIGLLEDLGKLLLKLNRNQNAQEKFRKILSLQPDNSTAATYLDEIKKRN